MLPCQTVTPLPIGGGCHAYLDLLSYWFVAALVPTGPTWSAPLPVPNDPSLIGTVVALQNYWVNLSTVTPFQITNGVYLGLGR